MRYVTDSSYFNRIFNLQLKKSVKLSYANDKFGVVSIHTEAAPSNKQFE